MDLESDIVIASLFCHHLKDDELNELFNWCALHAKTAVIINDLHRHPLAYYSIAWLTSLFSRSYLVKNDAKLSVLRGFKSKELISLVSRTGFQQITIKWCWAFRWLLIIIPKL
jgi:hypothetical protein